MHTHRFYRRRRRQVIWLTCASWLFALTAGVVNSCVLSLAGSAAPGSHEVAQDRVAPTDENANIAAASRSVDHHEHGVLVVDDGHDRKHDAPTGGCLKFCDDESSALLKSTPQTFDLSVAVVAAIESWRSVASMAGASARLAGAEPSAQGPPIVVRFLRLTL
jgi:hypothetical protein